MPRSEFSKRTRREALARSGGRCEGLLTTGERCNWPLANGFEIDHVIADQLCGKNELENAACLCRRCHKEKSASDAKIIAKAKRRADAHAGIKGPTQPIASPGFRKGPPQAKATRPLSKALPPRRPLYGDA